MVDIIMALPEGTKLYIMAPFVRGRKGEFRKELAEFMKQGYQRAKINGEIVRIEDAEALDKKYKHNIDIVVDRVVVREGLETRLADSLEASLRIADGLAAAEYADDPEQRILFSEKFACPVSGFTISEIEPRLFSFNNPFGACPTCDGLGKELKFSANLVVPDGRKSLAGGAILPWSKKPDGLYAQTLEALAKHYGFKVDTPFEQLSEGAQNVVLYGTNGANVKFHYRDGKRSYKTEKPFEGVIPNLERRYRETESTWMREELGKYMSNAPCEACDTKRLRPEALCVKVAGMDISEPGDMSIRDAYARFKKLSEELSDKDMEIAERILKEIRDRLEFLNAVGLDYLSLGRGSGSLSGGESQRIRLASQIGSGLTGVLYVLDEPSIGLHQRDNARLLETLQTLRDLGNTVLVVEHDEDAILTADYVVDMGPLAGVNGGEVVAAGTPNQIKKSKKSLTGQYLTGKKAIETRQTRRAPQENKMLSVKGATGNNLKNVDVDFPLGLMTCVTGVSGGGKSTLTIETLYKAVARRLNRGSSVLPMPHKALEGLEHLDKVIDIDQSPIGRTPRSNPATYTGAFTPIRDWFASLPEAKTRGYKPGRFSFNVKGGRCEACQGGGVIKIEMHFLPDVYVTCDVCDGARYNRETLEIKFKGKSIADVLNMSIDEGADFFKAVPTIRDKLVTLQRVGLGYIKVGQQATTLSGGEAQRVKLAKELAKRATGRTLYILDEPTTGLHFEDVNKLLGVLNELVGNGNTMIIIEHNLDVIKTADWIIDIGPEGGDGGGEIVAVGTPEDVAKVKASWTGRYLGPLLERDKGRK
jgi:excinuclease ABC subunit A